MVMHIDQGDTKSNGKWMRNDKIIEYSLFNSTLLLLNLLQIIN